MRCWPSGWEPRRCRSWIFLSRQEQPRQRCWDQIFQRREPTYDAARQGRWRGCDAEPASRLKMGASRHSVGLSGLEIFRHRHQRIAGRCAL